MSRAWPVNNLDPEAPVGVGARKVLAVRIAELYSYEPAVTEPAWSHELHDMRIAAKRLRYTLELFAPQFGEAGAQQIDRVKQVQEALGVLHDRDVEIDLVGAELTAAMADEADRVRAELATATPQEMTAIATSAMRPPPDDVRRGLITLLSLAHADRKAAYDRFASLWRSLSDAGMRRDLVALSIASRPERLEAESAA
ncbi:MAG: CHAD domain-containing protein [Thermomicrobiales bacterium]|nr:CHAD domain-containing protein [Thermomicrobiales bacterium]